MTGAGATAGSAAAWLGVGLLLGLVLGVLAATLAGRGARRRRRAPSSTAGPQPSPDGAAGPGAALAVDDLPRFREHPPGSPQAGQTDLVGSSTRSPAPPAARSAAAPGSLSTRNTVLAMVVAAALLVVVAVVVALAGGGGGGSASQADGEPTGTTTAPTDATSAGREPAVPTTRTPATATGTPAAALAFHSVPLGSDGLAARVTFEGMVLEQRAVGLTVTYPSLSVTTDGQQALAHVRLPTFNCLTTEPPADPLAAGCARSLPEYADLASPQLQVTRNGNQLDVAGLFPTYTRSNGSAPTYTGRTYQLTATVSADGPVRGQRAPATGVLQIGPDSSASTDDSTGNVLLVPS